MSTFSNTILEHKYLNRDLEEKTWDDIAQRVSTEVVRPYMKGYADDIYDIIRQKKFLPGGRYLYAAGRKYNQVNNCFLFDVEDTKESWADLNRRVTHGLCTGAGIGTVYSKIRPYGAPIKGMGGKATGPIALMQMSNEIGRHVMQGGSRRSALWAGLHWNHGDIDTFIGLKNWSEEVKAMKAKDFNFPASMDGTNISVILDDEFFSAYYDSNHPQHELARSVYWRVVRQMCETGEPGFSIDIGENAGEHLRNACTEVTSRDNNDVCNLGSINLAKISSAVEFYQVLDLATAFLMCGTQYSALPFQELKDTREKNRRLGIGLMGIHEWLLMRGYRYEPNEELEKWLQIYSTSTKISHVYADRMGVSRPVKTRAIAPTGTISIIAETTSGIEPVFCTAFKRRYLKGNTWYSQYVVDATAQRLIDDGVNPREIEDAYTLAGVIDRRIRFQSFVQQYVDHGISSTLNLPEWGSSLNNEDTLEDFGETLMKQLPNLRGITAYPDGARGGQPLTAVDYYEAIEKGNVEYEEYGNEHACVSGVCGI